MHHRLAELGSDERAEAEHASRLRRRVGAGTHTGRQPVTPANCCAAARTD
jgi:hypothetical protein